MKRNELFVTVSILASIISFIVLNILFKGWEKGEEGGRKEERSGRKEKTTPCPPPRISKKNRQHKEKVQKDQQHIYVLGYRFCYFPRYFWILELFRRCGIFCFDFISG